MIADDLRMPVVAEVVLLRRRRPVHGFEVRDHELRGVGPVAPRRRLGQKPVAE